MEEKAESASRYKQRSELEESSFGSIDTLALSSGKLHRSGIDIPKMCG